MLEWVEVLGWPIVVLIALALFHRSLIALLARSTKLRVGLPGGGSVEIEAHDAARLVEDMLMEVDSLIEGMNDLERLAMSRAAAADKPLRLGTEELFPDFDRGTDEHTALQNLRKRHLVRPVEGGRWRACKHVEVTPFGKLVLKFRRHELTGIIDG